MDFDELRALLASLSEHDVEYVLVGGVALNLHGVVRSTEDIDLFIRPTGPNVARLRTALRALWDDDDIDGITVDDFNGKYPTIRYGPPGTVWAIDLVSRLGTRFAFDDLEWEPVDVEGVRVRLATPRTLHRMKCDTVRPVDRLDAEALRSRFELKDDD